MLNYLVALILTLITEVPLGWLFLRRLKWAPLALFTINLITNPTLNLFLYYLSLSQYPPIPLIITLEIIVIILETMLLTFTFPQYSKTHFFLTSMIINTTSFNLGLIIF